MSPTTARTDGGAPLPVVALPQGPLLTVNRNDGPLLEDTPGEAVSARPDLEPPSSAAGREAGFTEVA